MPGTPRARIRASSKARRPAPPHRRRLVAIPAQALPPVAHIGGRPGEQTHPRTTIPAPAPPPWLRGPGHLLKLPPSNRTQASRCGLLRSSYGTRGANVPSTQCPPPESRAGLWQQTGTFGTLAPLTRIRQSIGLAHPSEESSARPMHRPEPSQMLGLETGRDKSLFRHNQTMRHASSYGRSLRKQHCHWAIEVQKTDAHEKAPHWARLLLL